MAKQQKSKQVSVKLLVLILVLSQRCVAELESLLDRATCAPYTTDCDVNWYCERLIDGNGLTKMTATDSSALRPNFTYKLDGIKKITTAFVSNQQFSAGSGDLEMNPSRITIGNSTNPFNNPICADDITDGGWFQCRQELYGRYISIYRTSSAWNYLDLWTLRAYSGENVLKDATVFSEPPEHLPTESASNLLWQYPRTS